MTIQLASPDSTDLATDEDKFTEEFSGLEDSTEYNFRELMDEVSKTGDLIITIPADQEGLLRQGLITQKSKDNAKLKTSGLMPDNMILAFMAYPAKDKDGIEREGVTDVRVKLRPKKSVSVLDLRIPNDEF